MSRSTLTGRVEHSAVIRNSRFPAPAAPVESPEAALAFVAEVGVADATHSWAYRVGALCRFSDDHEPAGTAGRPILAAIDGEGLDQVVAVVTRWYVGTKLGAGRLVRACGGNVAECLLVAPRSVLVDYVEGELAFAFDDTGAVHAALAAYTADRLQESFDADGTRSTLRLPADRLDALQAQLRDATRDRVRLSRPQ